MAGLGSDGQVGFAQGAGVGLGLATAALAVVISSLIYGWLSGH
jgi:hypothetical protein